MNRAETPVQQSNAAQLRNGARRPEGGRLYLPDQPAADRARVGGRHCLLANSRADFTRRVRLRGCVAAHGGCRIARSRRHRSDDGRTMAFLGLLGFLFLITLSASRRSCATTPESGSVYPAVPSRWNGLDRQDRSPGLLSASECFRSLPVSWHLPGSPPLLTSGGWWSMP
jgi:hypothetical protein